MLIDGRYTISQRVDSLMHEMQTLRSSYPNYTCVITMDNLYKHLQKQWSLREHPLKYIEREGVMFLLGILYSEAKVNINQDSSIHIL